MEIIIKNANIAGMLDTADKILQKLGKDGVPENIKGQATLSAMKKLFDGKNWLDVCAIKKMAEMNDVMIASEHQELFDTLHCVHWCDIHPETREYVTALLLDYFRGNISMAYAGDTVLE